MSEAAVTEPTTTTPELPEDTKLKELWQAYLQKSCEVGQLDHALEQLNSQKLEIEKTLEVTKRERNKASREHKELQQAKYAKIKPKEEPKLELKAH